MNNGDGFRPDRLPSMNPNGGGEELSDLQKERAEMWEEFASEMDEDNVVDHPIEDTPDTKDIETDLTPEPIQTAPSPEKVDTESSFADKINGIEAETYRKQQEAVDSIGNALIDGGFGEDSADQVEAGLNETFENNHNLMVESNSLISDYIDTLYPTDQDGGVSFVGDSPDASAIADDFLHNATKRSEVIAGGYKDFSDQIAEVMGDYSDPVTKHIDHISESITGFEQKYAILQKNYMDNPSFDNLTAMNNLIADYENAIDANHSAATLEAHSINGRIGDSLETALAVIVEIQKRDIESRQQALVDNVKYKAEAAELAKKKAYEDSVNNQALVEEFAIPVAAEKPDENLEPIDGESDQVQLNTPEQQAQVDSEIEQDIVDIENRDVPDWLKDALKDMVSAKKQGESELQAKKAAVEAKIVDNYEQEAGLANTTPDVLSDDQNV